MTQNPELTSQDLIAIEKEYCERSLANFVKQAWKVYDPKSPLVYGWHIDAICEHLEACTNGEITRLVINIPPGCMKSSLVNVLWPLYEWGPKGLAHYRIISASHDMYGSTRDTRAMRSVLQTEWFQSKWPVRVSADQNQKTYFENDSTGFRQACTVAGMTGKRGHRVLWDDPLTAEDANSEEKRETVLRQFQETLPTRFVDPGQSVNVIVMQRLHEQDPSGFILQNELNYEHLMLPMEFESDRRCVTSIGFQDPRKEDGELLFPDRFTRDYVDQQKNGGMTEYAIAGQFQQRPMPRGGGLFTVSQFGYLDRKPNREDIARSVRYWDKAGTTSGGAYTVGVLMHLMVDGTYVVGDVVRGQWSAFERERRIKETAQQDGERVSVWVEQEPGSGGKESAQNTIRNLAGFKVHADRVTGDKESRAEPYAAQVEAGNVCLVRGGWNRPFLQEHEAFPTGTYKDQVDAAAGAFAKLQQEKRRGKKLGIPRQVKD